jgi:DNA-binding transcriptional LysR family regulator
MDKLRAMQMFLRIVDVGSLTGAAQSLGTSLPSVVRVLAELERSLGVRLLNRTTRRLALTEEGEQYAQRCRLVLQEIDDMEAALVDQSTQIRGALTITAPVLLGQMLVAPATRRFAQRYSQVQCRVVLSDSMVDLIEAHMDVGVRIDNLEDSSLVGQTVGSVRRVVVASPSYLAQAGTPQHPKDLAALQCVSAGRPWLFQEAGREFSMSVQGNLSFNLGAPAIEACASGAGLGMFLSYQVEPYVRSGALQVVLQAFERPPMEVSVVYPQARLVPARTRLYIDWLVAELRAAMAPA